jgi:hypothetical protein
VAIAKEKTGLSNFKSTGVPRGFLEVIAAAVFFMYRGLLFEIGIAKAL